MKEKLIELALHCGAYKAEALNRNDIVTNRHFREICESNACGNCGRCWMCPPDVGDIDALLEQLNAYSQAVLYQCVGHIEDSFDIEGMTAVAERFAQLGKRIQLALQQMTDLTFLHLGCGGCRLCARCAKVDNQPCRQPELALPSLEAYGIDVYQTSLATSLKYNNSQNTVTYFGMILLGG